jgi:tetratricopeptide (TPR) repeat protein
VIDIASTTGIVGISAYMLIFVFLGIYLVKLFRAKRISALEFTLISCLTIAYFVQNLAVFDSLVTYVSLMILLGYVHFLANNKEDKGNSLEILSKSRDRGLINKEIYAFLGFGLLMFLIIWNYNILPTKMLTKTIDGQIAFGQRNLPLAISEYREALKYNTPLDRDSRFTLNRSALSYYYLLANMPQKERDETIEFLIEEAEKNVELSPFDTLLQMQLARTADMATRSHSDSVKRQEYTQLALYAIDKSIEASPGRIPTYFIKSQILLNLGQRDEAISILEYAASLSEDYYESYCQLAQAYLMSQEVDTEYENLGLVNLDKCLAHDDGYSYIVAVNAIRRGINHYASLGDMDKVVRLYEQLVKYDSKTAQNWIVLAKLYDTRGEYDKAISTIENAVKIDPNLQSDVDEFIKSVKQKKGE